MFCAEKGFQRAPFMYDTKLRPETTFQPSHIISDKERIQAANIL